MSFLCYFVTPSKKVYSFPEGGEREEEEGEGEKGKADGGGEKSEHGEQ